MSAETRVLIVDDEPEFCSIIEKFLRNESYELHFANCGREALRLFDEDPAFDVVLLDLNLPDMNGFKVMGYLAEHFPETLVVIITGYASLESATEALRCGAYDYLTKPFAREELYKTLQNAVAHKQVKEAHRQSQLALNDSEKCFRNLVENILSGVLIVRNQELLYQNTIQKELFGPITEAVIACEYQHIHPDDLEKLKGIVGRFLSKETPSVETDFRFYTSVNPEDRSEQRWVLSRASYISYRGETAILINTMDISRLKELERLVTIKNKMHSLGRVAAGVAHEIRNPLTGINSYLFSLRGLIDSGISSENDTQLAQQMTERIQTASDKIETVIKRVMDFAKPGAPEMALTDINDIIRDAINLSEVTLRKKEIRLETSYGSDLSKCYADKGLIGQVILNLINNAVHALTSRALPRRLGVSSFSRNGRVVIQVSDSGPGISKSLKDKIFDPFFTTKDDGAGIGLNIAQRIIADHHGMIEVSESEWKGAQFTIELPVDRRSMSR
jgi:PAS domain S-box-containing protein